MPSFERDGATLYYEDRGSGRPVVLQHPLTADGQAWHAIGVPAALERAGFRVVVPDALGHGRSSPLPPGRAGLSARVADLLALADHLDLERFHYAGYSMGGWIGTGLVRDACHRLLSISIAGWDPVDGARRFTALTGMPERRSEFEQRISVLLSLSGDRRQPSEESFLGYADTYERLFKDLPSIATLIGRDLPIMIAVGCDDPYFEPAHIAAESLDVAFLKIPGDHLSAFMNPSYAAGLVEWVTQQR